MINEIWSDEALNLPPCRPMHGPNNEVLFMGPRVKMGIYEGLPTRICPHTTTGRADYFGPFVNRLHPAHKSLRFLTTSFKLYQAVALSQEPDFRVWNVFKIPNLICAGQRDFV